MSGSQYSMPIIVLNMGCEMIYILHQRLQAQNVPEEKAKKVLQDVVKSMVSDLFIQELFKPQDIYTANSTKQIFEKLAHASIMRLNKSSMDKLYDLMSMGFKYQLIQSKAPQQFLQITLNHLESLKDLVDSEGVCHLIQVAIDRSIETYSTLTLGQWYNLKYTLMKFVQGKKVKVSLFLQNQMQTIDGVIILSNNGILPYRTDIPGTIRFFENGKLVNSSAFPNESASSCEESVSAIELDSSLGLNMYSKVKTEAKSERQVSLEHVNQILTSKFSLSRSPPSTIAASKPRSNPVTASSAKAELNLLADLLGISPGAKEDEADAKPFRINLFPDFAKSSGGSSGDKEESTISIEIDASADAKSLQSYFLDLDLNDDKSSAKVSEEDDLLSLMDSAK